MRNYSLIFLLFLVVRPSLASSVKWDLQAQISKGHRPLGYKTARKILFGKIYLQKGNFIEDIYCQITFSEKDGVGPLKIPDHKKLNTEHAWPKTRFTKAFPFHMQKSDLLHLFPPAPWANSYRGDLFFGGEEEIYESIPGCPLSSRGIGFTPPENVKGDLARALFYFSIRYNIPIDDKEEGFLRKWHRADRVDLFEMDKNDIVEKYQGNRNPFIDDPDIIELVEDF